METKAGSVALLAAIACCAFLALLLPVEGATYHEKVLYSFCSQQNCTDGTAADAGLIDVKGTLYGVTAFGGAYDSGALFAVNRKTGAESVVYSFCSRKSGYDCLDGALPQAALIAVKGMLYGTAQQGGNLGCESRGCGIVFSVNPNTGAETVIHNFGGTGDGAVPLAGLVDVNGILYGTTLDGGGSCGCGTVFSIDANTGTEAVVHSFGSGADGSYPRAGLVAVKGKVYGTTEMGGTYDTGAIFSVDPAGGTEKVRYSFCAQFGCPDGAQPEAALIDADGVLYGTTVSGGTAGCAEYTPAGCGTAFAFDPDTGTETVLYAFCQQQDCADGALPFAGLTEVDGTLYGMTSEGGGTGCDYGYYGCGTAFAIDPATGAEAVLYAFCARPQCIDGWNPQGALTYTKGRFYGVAGSGGAYNGGAVFAIRK